MQKQDQQRIPRRAARNDNAKATATPFESFSRKMTRYPLVNRSLHFAQMALKEMVCAFHQDKLLWFRSKGKKLLQVLIWAKLVACSADKQLGPGAALEKFVGIEASFSSNGSAERDQAYHALIGTGSPQSGGGAKREAAENDGQVEFGVQPIEPGTNVVNLTLAVVVHALAESGIAEVEAEHRKSEGVQRLHGVIHNFVVHGAAIHRVGMADQGGVSGARLALVQQSFEFAGGAAQK